jgi:hypothetical protein
MLKIYYDCAHMNMNHETKFEFKIENWNGKVKRKTENVKKKKSKPVHGPKASSGPANPPSRTSQPAHFYLFPSTGWDNGAWAPFAANLDPLHLTHATWLSPARGDPVSARSPPLFE